MMRARTPAPGGDAPASPRPIGFALEPGERILWQGRPRAGALRRHLLKARWLAAYFAVLLAWKLALIAGGRGLRPQEVADAATLVAQGAVLMALLAFFAQAIARSTTYTVTDLRVVIRHGVALPGTVDIPLRALRGLGVRMRRDGGGDVELRVRAGGGIGYAKLWPHARGLAFARPIPTLRGLPDAAALGTLLARRLGGLHAASPAHTQPASEPTAPAARAA